MKHIRLKELLLSSFKTAAIFFPLWLSAQKFSGETLRIRLDSLNLREAEVEQIFYLSSPLHPGDTLWFYDYLHAYASINSSLGQAIAGHYKLEFHFSSKKDRGDTYLEPSEQYELFRKDGFVGLMARDTLQKPILRYRVRFPSAKFTGLGRGKDFLHLFEFFLQPVVKYKGKYLFYPNRNLDDRPHLPLSLRVELYPASMFPYWESNGQILSRGDTLIVTHTSDRIEIIGSQQKFYRIRRGNTLWIFEGSIPLPEEDSSLALSMEKTAAFLEQYHVPLPSKILITRRDWLTNPVYGLHILPVVNPFPRDFSLEINILKQTLYKAGKERFWDARRDHSLFTGLWQFYLKKYVETRYPDLKITGSPLRIFPLRYYYLFRAPYTQKYYLSYLYMARMNRDQALRLPADSLSLFNRNVTNPYKAALGWEFLYRYGSKNLFDSLTTQWFRRSAEKWAGRDFLEAKMKTLSSRGEDFLWDDFWNTAAKIDFSLRKTSKLKGNRIVLKNRSGLKIPVTVKTEPPGDSVMLLMPFKGDTVLPRPAQANKIIVNADNPLPEIYMKNNLAPRLKRPVKIRLWQDLEEPFSVQLFINPVADYNYYDGLMLGLSLNNHTFFDKYFSWEIKPQYGFKSGYLNTYVNIKAKKHFVRPFLHGISAGGYYASSHYAPQKLYRSYSIYATLSHKNRKEKFFRENDFNVEWLSVYKQTDRPDLTSSYGVLIFSDTYRRRGLLKNTVWKSSVEWHPLFIKFQTDFRRRMFIDKFRQLEWRIYAGWMPYNRTGTDYFSFALSRPVDYLFKYNYYGRSETSGIFYQQYVYAEGAFKVFYEDQFADHWMLVQNLYVGLWKRFNLFADAGWMHKRGKPAVFHYDAGLRYYLIPDYFEFYFPLYADGRWITPDKNYFDKIRIMFVFDLGGLSKMFTRSWY